MLGLLSRIVVRRPRRVVAAIALLAVVAGVLGGGVADRLAPYGADDPASESYRAEHLLERSGANAATDVVALVRPRESMRTAAGRAEVLRVAAKLRRDPDIGRVATFREGGTAFVSRDGRASYVTASFRADVEGSDAGERLRKRFEGRPRVELGGGEIANVEANDQVSSDLARAELLAIPFLLVLSFVFFRSGVAALLPPMVGITTILLTFLSLRIASEFGSVSVFSLNLVTGLGLGLAIDYSLFVVSRFREEMERSTDRGEALRRTLATAGRTVLFSSLTVAAAMSALLVFPQRFLYSMGIGGVLVALLASAVALTLLPAVLMLLGPRVNALAPRRLQRAREREARGEESGAWYRLSRFVMRRPARVAIASAAALVALGIPFLSIDFTTVDASVLPTSASARQVDQTLQRDFPPHRTSPTFLAAEESPGPRLDAYMGRLRRVDGVAGVSAPRPVAPGLTRVDVVSSSGPLTPRSERLVEDLRALDPPFPVSAGGATAHFLDLKESLASHLPVALAIIALATIIVLFAMTGSVVLPVKAVLMNLLTLSATFGALILIFQDGRFEGLLGYSSQGALEITQPIVLLAIVFGLSTDYGVFLLSRIKEARDQGASDHEAVAIGLQRTGRIITAAALLFCIAIGAFATSKMIFIKELGVGTALAVLIDATIVRALLVPSLMAQRPLRHLHDRFGLSDADPSHA